MEILAALLDEDRLIDADLLEGPERRAQLVRGADAADATAQELRAKRQELREANSGGTFNEALATQKLQESAGLQAKLMGEQFRMRQEMLSVLTPEQKTQLEQKRAEFKAKRANHGERQVQ